MENNMNIEIWSDVVCPWCYIGKRRFEAALAQFAHRDQVTVVWRSYQLDPSAPKASDKTVTEMLTKKYGVSAAQAAAMNERVSMLAAEEGLEYHLENAKHSNTFDAHRLIHLSKKYHLQDQMKERLLKAYFSEEASIGETETLVALATEVGIDADEARAVLNSNAYASDVRTDEQLARTLGIQGVPFFAIDDKYGVSGAQPTELFQEALERAWADSHPLIQIGTQTDDAGVCVDDTCLLPSEQ